MRNLLILFVLALTVNVLGQKTLTFEGPFVNGMPFKATARYNYFLDQKGQQIKHGSFRYIVKEKTSDTRLMHNFSGNYSKGLKSGQWEYIIKSKDYIVDNQGFTESAEIQMMASYSEGLPDGKWTFSANITKRKKVVVDSKEQWVNFQVVKHIYIIANFKQGVLVDSLIIHDLKNGDSLYAFADENGFMQSLIFKKNGKISSDQLYEKGILISNNNVENKEFHMIKKNPNGSYFFDTLSLLKSPDFQIFTYLKDNFFNKAYFLYERIEGDAVFQRNGRGLIGNPEIGGLFVLDLIPQLSSNQQKIIDDIYYYYSKSLDIQQAAQRKLKENPKDQKLQKANDDLKYITSEILKYHCSAKLTLTITLPSELFKKSSNSCGQLPDKFSKITNVNNWLNELLSASRNAWIEADKLSKTFIN
jgi:hypothetical protein